VTKVAGMAQKAILAKIPAKPGMRADLVKAAQAAIDNANTEPGTTYYILHEDDKDADLLWMYELYTDEAARDAHLSSDGMKALGPIMGPFVGGKMELIFLTPTIGKGL
jgi:quinol monooxygenase YgiN